MKKYSLTDSTWDECELDAISKVVASGNYTMGKKTKEFEELFAEKFKSPYAIMVNSGSSANLIAIASLFYSGKLNKGDEVIVPAVSWSTTYYPLYQYGLKLKFVDIDISTLNMCVDQLEDAISSKTKAIFAVNLLGNPNEYDRIFEICNNYNLILIEDNCESMGGSYNNSYTGTFGLIGTFSMFYSHHISTMEGGVILTRDKELYHYMLSLRAHGWTRDIPDGSNIFSKHNNSFYNSYNFIVPGYNCRPLEIQAAVGITQLDKLNAMIINRRKNADHFKDVFKNLEFIKLQKETGNSSWFGFSMVLVNEFEGKRDYFIKKLVESGIETRPIVAGNFTKNQVIKYFDYEVFGDLKNADYIHDNGFFVGNQSKIISGEINYLKAIISNSV